MMLIRLGGHVVLGAHINMKFQQCGDGQRPYKNILALNKYGVDWVFAVSIID